MNDGLIDGRNLRVRHGKEMNKYEVSRLNDFENSKWESLRLERRPNRGEHRRDSGGIECCYEKYQLPLTRTGTRKKESSSFSRRIPRISSNRRDRGDSPVQYRRRNKERSR